MAASVRLRPEHPATLALLRIVVCALVLISPEVLTAPRKALVAPALRIAPEGLAWFIDIVPIAPWIAKLAQLGVALGAFAGLVGYRPRLAMAMVTCFGFYLFALSQLSGAVLHDMHLLWFAAVLAVSPCGDALCVPGARPGPPPARSMAYSVPLVFVRALLAAVYFFPGMWKLRASGLEWALSDNLRNQMYIKWFEWGGWLPAVRIDEHPLLLRASALSVLAFELSFPLLMLGQRMRLFAGAGGLVFHLASATFMRIHFAALWLCYVVLVDWGDLAQRVHGGPNPATPPDADTRGGVRARHLPGWAPALVGIVLLAGAVVQGLRGATFAWPFGCYPTFQWRAAAELPDLELVAQFDDGRRVLIDSGGYRRGRSQERWGTVWNLAGLTHAPPSEGALRAYWNSLDLGPARGAVRGRVERVIWSVLPEDWDHAPRSTQVIADLVLDPQSGMAL